MQIGNALGGKGVFQTLTLVQRATAEKRPRGGPWSLRYKCRRRKRLANLCQKCVLFPWTLPYVASLLVFVIVSVLVVLSHSPGVHPWLPLSVLWSQLSLILQII